MLYYNKKAKEFEEQKTKTTSAAKILLTAEILEENKAGTYGPDELEGQYYSTVGGEDFLWRDLHKALLDPQYDIEILNPWDYHSRVCIDR